MLWIARYTKTDFNLEVVANKVGIFDGGNCREVIRKVCKLHGIHLPKEQYKGECKFAFRLPAPNAEGLYDDYEIDVAPIDAMIDLIYPKEEEWCLGE